MSEQTILLDENDLLSLLNGGSFHTLVGEQKYIKQSPLKPPVAPALNYRYQIVDTKAERNVYQEWYNIQLIQISEEQ